MDSIYENVTISKLEPKRTDPPDVHINSKRYTCTGVIVSLVLLCLLLSAGITALALKINTDNSKWNRRIALFNRSYSNLSEEADNLRASVQNLTQKVEKLQKRFDAVTNERNDLQRKIEGMLVGWRSFNGSYYKMSSETKTWQESRQDCQRSGGDLAIISSKEEQDFIRGFEQVLWIGLSDRETEGVWKWVDGTQPTKSYWDTGEPNGSPTHDEDCGQIKRYGELNSWNDELCDNLRQWVCERSV